MTDEEIEKATEYCLSAESCFSCADCKYKSGNKTIIVCYSLVKDLLDYINHHKEKINTLEQNLEKFGMVYTGMLEFQDKLKSAAVEKAKKDTAKEILTEWRIADDEGGGFNSEYIANLRRQHSVEVDNE